MILIEDIKPGWYWANSIGDHDLECVHVAKLDLLCSSMVLECQRG